MKQIILIIVIIANTSLFKNVNAQTPTTTFASSDGKAIKHEHQNVFTELSKTGITSLTSIFSQNTLPSGCNPPNCDGDNCYCIDNQSDCDFIFALTSDCGQATPITVPAHTKMCGIQRVCICVGDPPNECCACPSFMSVLNDPNATHLHWWTGAYDEWIFEDYGTWSGATNCTCPGGGIKVSLEAGLCSDCNNNTDLNPSGCNHQGWGYKVVCKPQ